MKRMFNQRNSRQLVLGLGAAILVAGSALAIDHMAGSKVKDTPKVQVEVDETPVKTQEGHFTTLRARRQESRAGRRQDRGHVQGLQRQPAAGVWLPMIPSGGSSSASHSATRCRTASSSPPRQHGLGSGVIVTKDGYILTNNHVVDGAQEVKVTLQDGREFTAKVIGRDPKSDIAVIKIDAKDLPVVPMADSDKVQVGDRRARHRQSVRRRPDRHHRHRQRHGPRQPRHRGLRGLHPDRRRHQSRQLGRRARGRRGPAHRHQHRHLQPQRRQPGHRLCHPLGPRPQRHEQPDQRRQGRRAATWAS